jgi:hypothetical protein
MRRNGWLLLDAMHAMQTPIPGSSWFSFADVAVL